MSSLRAGGSPTSVLLLLSVAVAACGGGDGGDGGDSPTGPTAQDLVGGYELISFKFQDQPAFTPPAAVGTLVLTLTTYQVDISINFPLDTMRIHDEGTYSIGSNGTWAQESTTMDVQSVGTFELGNDTLSVDVTAQGQRILNVWRRTS